MTENETMASAMQDTARMWWLWLVAGIGWVIFSVIVLQFDTQSAAAVGIIFGLMLLVAGLQYVVVGTQVEGWNWLWYLFGAILIIGGVISLFYPTRTFLAIANILGFLFAIIGLIWIMEAFVTKEGNDLWWLSLVAGILMIALGFWLGGQFLFTKVETLLVFAGIWALMKGIVDIIVAFQVKKLGKITAGV